MWPCPTKVASLPSRFQTNVPGHMKCASSGPRRRGIHGQIYRELHTASEEQPTQSLRSGRFRLASRDVGLDLEAICSARVSIGELAVDSGHDFCLAWTSLTDGAGAATHRRTAPIARAGGDRIAKEKHLISKRSSPRGKLLLISGASLSNSIAA